MNITDCICALLNNLKGFFNICPAAFLTPLSKGKSKSKVDLPFLVNLGDAYER
jgi:hypothetical protein